MHYNFVLEYSGVLVQGTERCSCTCMQRSSALHVGFLNSVLPLGRYSLYWTAVLLVLLLR
jgi:hypothetical protein